MSSNGSDATWHSLLADKKQDIENVLGQGYPVTAKVNSDRSFRDVLETFCKKQGERKLSRLEARVFPSYKHIIDLAKAVGTSAAAPQQSAGKDTLESLVWRISFAVIEVNGIISQCYVADRYLGRAKSWSSA